MLSFRKFLQEIDSKEITTGLKFNTELNPKLWDGMKLKDEVRKKLEKIAAEFTEFLGVSESAITDVIITGSSAGFNYSDLSDIDLHLVVDFGQKDFCPSCTTDFVTDCFQSKKTLWNSSHDISIFGHDVELYAQDANEKHIAPGVFSLKNNSWVNEPDKTIPTYDSIAVQLKSGEIMNVIDSFIDSMSDDKSAIADTKEKIRKMRQAGLQSKAGLYSVENLAFKTLRNNGYLDKLNTYLRKIEDTDLSLN